MMAVRETSVTTLGALLGVDAGKYSTLPLSDLVLDSREVHAGAGFVAVQGTHGHGLAFAAEAVARGASVVLHDGAASPAQVDALAVPSVPVPHLRERLGDLANRLYGPLTAHMELAGVTGTNGKTTVAWLVAQAAGGSQECGYLGTLGFGVPPDITPHALTTPDCFTLRRELGATGTGRTVLEVSSHALSQDRVAGLAIPTTAFTNLSRDHLDAHGDLEHYGLAKSRLFTRPGVRKAVINVGDAFGLRLVELLPAAVEPVRVAVGALVPGVVADLRAEVVDRGLQGLLLDISGRFGSARLASPLIGDFNAENLLVALGMLLAWGYPLAEAAEDLARAVAPPGRFEVQGGDDKPTVVVDFAHTPAGLERVLSVLKRLTQGELWCVFGCGGDRDSGKRALMGAAAVAVADHIVLTDDNPRSEDPVAITNAIRAGMLGAARGVSVLAEVEHDRGAAINFAVQRAVRGDVVLVAGKGHEVVQLVGGEARPFSDRDVVRAALEGWQP